MYGNDTEKIVIPQYHLKWRSVRGHKLTWYGTVYNERGIVAAIRRLSQDEDGKVQISEGGQVEFKTKKRVYIILPVKMDVGHDMSFKDEERDLMHAMKQRTMKVQEEVEGSQ